MTRLSHGFRGLSAAALALVLPAAAAAQSNADWPLHGHDLGAQRYSQLNSIDTLSVGRLKPAWTFHSGVTATFQATPIVDGDVMYVSLPYSSVVALDAKNGHELWRYTHDLEGREAVLRPRQSRRRGGGGTSLCRAPWTDG